MSVNIVLPDLPNFVQQRVTAIYSAKTEADFDAAFDAFVAQDVRITLNGKHSTRDAYKKLLQGETSNVAAGNGAEIQFQGVVSVPSDSSNPDAIGTGTVGAFFKATLFGRIIVFGEAESSTVNSSLNVVVAKDTSLHHHQVGRGGAFDARRAMVIDDVITDTQNPIVPPTTPLPPTSLQPTA